MVYVTGVDPILAPILSREDQIGKVPGTFESRNLKAGQGIAAMVEEFPLSATGATQFRWGPVEKEKPRPCCGQGDICSET